MRDSTTDPTATAADGSNDTHSDDGQPGEAPSPETLQVEYEHSPTNVALDEPPRFTWKVPARWRDVKQTAYRIVVADSRDGLADEKTVWDSGQVRSSQSIAVPYDGNTLEPDTTYYWKVRIWDQDDNPSPWTDVAKFTTALPDTDAAWDGTWIGQSPDLKGGPADIDWGDYVLEADATIDQNGFGLVFRAQDENDLYRWQIMLASSPHNEHDEHVLATEVREDGEWEALETVSIHEVLEDAEYAQHRYKITADADKLTTHIDGTRVHRSTDDTYADGNFGIWAEPRFPDASEDANEAVWVDRVAVRNLDGDVLFETNFSHSVVRNFTDGVIRDGRLYYESVSPWTEAPSNGIHHNVILHGSPFDSSPQMRTDVTLDAPISSARAHVFALGYGDLYVNGERIGDDELNLFTDYTKRVVYSSYDITDALHSGENGIGLWLGRGFFSKPPSEYMPDRPWVQSPQALLQVNVTYADGSTDTITTDSSWTMRRSPILENDVYDGETYDARLEEPDWSTAEFETDWESVLEREPPGEDAVRQPLVTPPIEVTKTLEPESITEVEDGYVIDFGQNHAGWTELTIHGASAGDAIEIHHAELVRDDGDLDRRTNRSAQARNVYVTRGDDVETYEPRFTYHGYRYAKVIGYPGKLTADDIVAKAVHTANDIAGSFECSNETINRLQSNAVWGLRSNSHGFVTDSPQRDERMGYTGDNHIAAPAYLYNFDAINFYRQWLDQLDDAQTVDNPHGIGQQVPPESESTWPNWGLVRLSLPWWLYERTGDTKILENHYDEMRAYVDSWVEQAEDGLLSTMEIGDHMAPHEDGYADIELLTTTAHYRGLDIMADVAAALGYEDDAEIYSELAGVVEEAFHDEFFDSETGLYGSGTQTASAVPLSYGMVPGEHEGTVVTNLTNKIRNEDEGRLFTGFLGTAPLLRTLADHGYEDLAFHVITQPQRPGWGYMLQNGATTMWEGWDMVERLEERDDNLTSRNHSPFSLVSEWFYRYLAGIRVDEPGFSHVRIAPKPAGDLEWVRAEVETPRGTVGSHWDRAGDDLSLGVTIPGNATATVEIPILGGDAVAVSEGGTTIWEDGDPTATDLPGINSVGRDDSRIVVEVGAGEYGFELELLR